MVVPGCQISLSKLVSAEARHAACTLWGDVGATSWKFQLHRARQFPSPSQAPGGTAEAIWAGSGRSLHSQGHLGNLCSQQGQAGLMSRGCMSPAAAARLSWHSHVHGKGTRGLIHMAQQGPGAESPRHKALAAGQDTAPSSQQQLQPAAFTAERRGWTAAPAAARGQGPQGGRETPSHTDKLSQQLSQSLALQVRRVLSLRVPRQHQGLSHARAGRVQGTAPFPADTRPGLCQGRSISQDERLCCWGHASIPALWEPKGHGRAEGWG